MTITGYLGWAVGLVLALGTLGVNSTSLAMVFGALSIGIGFGLQTIFNNFISAHPGGGFRGGQWPQGRGQEDQCARHRCTNL